MPFTAIVKLVLHCVFLLHDAGDFKSTSTWDDTIMWYLIIIVWHELTIDVVPGPFFRYFIHKAGGVGHICTDRTRHICIELLVLGFIMTIIPVVVYTVVTDFKYECILITAHLKYFYSNKYYS